MPLKTAQRNTGEPNIAQHIAKQRSTTLGTMQSNKRHHNTQKTQQQKATLGSNKWGGLAAETA